MFYRITFSTNVDEYYKENANDTQLSMTVESDSFEHALIRAKMDMDTLLFWPGLFEVVSVRKIDLEEPDKVEELRVEGPVKKAPEIWCHDTGIVIMDPDGWRGRNDPAWDEPITRDEFIRRASFSTCRMWPQPLWDEVTDVPRIY